MVTRTPHLHLVVLLVLSTLAGCSLGTAPPSDPKAERLVDETLSVRNNTTAYSYDIRAEATASRGDRTDEKRLAGAGRVNVTTKRMAVTTERPRETAIYLDGQTVYARCPLSEYVNVADVWYAAEPVPRNRSFRSYTELGTGRVLQSGRTYYEGNRTLNGEHVDVVTVVPDKGVYREVLSQRINPTSDRPRQGTLKNVTVRLWIDADTKRLQKISTLERRSVRDIDLRLRTVLTYRYGPVSIELPETVESKTECPDL